MTSSCLDTRDTLAETLERFNRKERNLLIRDVLGNYENRLLLRKKFLEEVAKALKIDSIEREAAYWWTDYHYDWLAGALAVHFEGDSAVKKKGSKEKKQPRQNRPSSESSQRSYLVGGNQEDADLVIVSGSDLILIEAKAYGPWDKKQMKSKFARLELLRQELNGLREAFISENAKRDIEVRLHLVLVSPYDNLPNDLRELWPGWLRRGDGVPWVALRLPEKENILDVSRCDVNVNKKKSTEFWRIGERSLSKGKDRRSQDRTPPISHRANYPAAP